MVMSVCRRPLSSKGEMSRYCCRSVLVVGISSSFERHFSLTGPVLFLYLMTNRYHLVCAVVEMKLNYTQRPQISASMMSLSDQINKWWRHDGYPQYPKLGMKICYRSSTYGIFIIGWHMLLNEGSRLARKHMPISSRLVVSHHQLP